MRFCSTEISNIRVGKVYIEHFIIWGRNRCFAWMDSTQTRGNKRNRSLWGKNSKFLVTLDQPKSLIIKKGCFKSWLFTLNSSILSLQTYFERNRKLRHESAVQDFCPRLHVSHDRGIPNSWHLKLQQLIFWVAERTIPWCFGYFFVCVCFRFLNDIRNSEHETDIKISCVFSNVDDYLIVTFYCWVLSLYKNFNFPVCMVNRFGWSFWYIF